MDQALNSQKTPHTSPLRASYGMSFVSILMKNDRVIKGFYHIFHGQWVKSGYYGTEDLWPRLMSPISLPQSGYKSLPGCLCRGRGHWRVHGWTRNLLSVPGWWCSDLWLESGCWGLSCGPCSWYRRVEFWNQGGFINYLVAAFFIDAVRWTQNIFYTCWGVDMDAQIFG